MATTFQTDVKGGCRRLLTAELRVIERLYPNMPLVPVKGKSPKDKGWQNNPKTAPELIEVFNKPTHYTGYGCLLGYPFDWRGHKIALMALDIDGLGAQEELDKILNGRTLERTVAWTSRREHRSQHLFFVREDDFEKLRTKKLKSDRTGDDGKIEMLEFRWKGLQSVLPPSYHPMTGNYEWIRSLEEEAIEPIPEYLKEIMMGGDSNNWEEQQQLTIPQSTNKPPASNRLPKHPDHIQLPVPEAVPLLECCSKDTRNLVGTGTPEGGGRNDNALKIAIEAMEVAGYLSSIGQSYTDTPCSIVRDFCKRSGMSDRETEERVRWGMDRKVNDPRYPESIEACVRSWYWNNYIKPQGQHHTHNTPTASIRLSLSLHEAVEQARKALEAGSDELTLNIILEDIRTRADVSGFFWEQKILKPLKRDVQKARFKLELQRIADIENKIEQSLEVASLAPKYSMSAGVIHGLLKEVKKQTNIPTTRAYALDELLELETPGLDFIVPGWLPVGETVILGGSPKAGKTLFSADLAFAVATGESHFLGEKVKQGKVLIVQADESLNSCKSKLLRRGFRSKDANNVRILPQWDVTQMSILEEQLEDFRPDVVIIDSLRRINHGSEISENSAEFADNIYTLKETLQRYGASGVLIHHTNKDREALGVNRMRGSSAIAGAVWGVWHLDHLLTQDPENKKKSIIDPSDLRRTLELSARDSEGLRVRIELNPENNSFKFQGDIGISEEEQNKRKTLQDRILTLLQLNTEGLGGKDIIELLSDPKPSNGSVYATLNRLVNRRQISSKSGSGDNRYTIYFIPQNDKQTEEQQQEPIENESATKLQDDSLPPPSPPVFVVENEKEAETNTQQGIEIHNNYITTGENYITSRKEETTVLDIPNPEFGSDSEIDNISTAEVGGGEYNEKIDTHITGDVTTSHEPQPQQSDWVKDPYKAPLILSPEDAIALLTTEWTDYIEISMVYGLISSQLKSSLTKASEKGLCERRGDLFRLRA